MFRGPVKFGKPYETPILKSIKVTGYFHTWLAFMRLWKQGHAVWGALECPSWSLLGFWGALSGARLSLQPPRLHGPVLLGLVLQTLRSTKTHRPVPCLENPSWQRSLMLKFSFLGSILHCFGVWKLFPVWTGVVLRNFSIFLSRTFSVLPAGGSCQMTADLLSLFLVSTAYGAILWWTWNSFGRWSCHIQASLVSRW